MRLSAPIGGHLTYCTNIHAGETLADVGTHIAGPIAAVAAHCSADRPFGLGLRLGAAAVRDLAAPQALDRLRGELAVRNLYVFTVNGFPYGPFHGQPVKAGVYRPDWREAERLAYTCRLADLLARLLPDDVEEASLSTLPGCFKADCADDPDGAAARIADNLLRAVTHCARLAEETGRRVTIALEPEPLCLLETTAEAVAFFERHLLAPAALARLGALTGLGSGAAEQVLRRHLGVCLDACHAAVAFEDVDGAVSRLEAAGIRIAKLQLSAGLIVDAVDDEAIAALVPFADAVYLHQVIERRDGRLRRFADLADAFAAHRAEPRDGAEWRVHVHVPIVAADIPPLRSSQGWLAALLARQQRQPISAHLEVETYTWSVLPPALRSGDVVTDIVRELTWARERLGERIEG